MLPDREDRAYANGGSLRIKNRQDRRSQMGSKNPFEIFSEGIDRRSVGAQAWLNYLNLRSTTIV